MAGIHVPFANEWEAQVPEVTHKKDPPTSPARLGG